MELRPTSGGQAYRIKVSGLVGGHSGLDIHKGRGNAVRILGRLLQALTTQFPVEVAELNGGSKRNAIPREASTVIVCDPAIEAEVRGQVNAIAAASSAELGAFDPGLQVTMTGVDKPAAVLSGADALAVAALLASQHHGVLSMSPAIAGLVQTSTNLATVSTIKDEVVIESSQRSSIESSKRTAGRMVATVFRNGRL